MSVTIIEDVYGNIKEHIINEDNYFEKREYEYNKSGDLLSNCSYDKNGELLHKTVSENHYDEHGNLSYQKQIFTLYDEGIIISKYQNCSVMFYENQYDNHGNLKEVVCKFLSNDEQSILNIQKLYYKHNLLVKKELLKEPPFTNVFHTSFFTYDEDGNIKEEQILLKNEITSHFVIYTPIKDGRYRKTIVNPDRSRFRWMLEDVDNSTCSICLYETCVTVELLKEILEYILKQFNNLKEVIISLNYAEDVTYIKDIEEFENSYKKTHDITITRIP